MRALLQFLGIVEPEADRREPVALPAWSRRLAPLLVLGLAVVSSIAFALIRGLLSRGRSTPRQGGCFP